MRCRSTDGAHASRPAVVDELVIVGSSIGDNRAVNEELGIVRAFDARTGQLRWQCDPIPRSPDNPVFGEWVADGLPAASAAETIAGQIPLSHSIAAAATSPGAGNAGGSNRGGIAFDPERQIAIANTMNLPFFVALVPRAEMEAQRNDPRYEDFEFAEQRGTPYGSADAPSCRVSISPA